MSLPCSSVHWWHSCLLTVLQLPNRAYPCFHIFPIANNKPAEVLFVISVLFQLLRMQWDALSPLLLPTFAARAQTPQWFLKQRNVYKSIPRLFLPHSNRPEIAIGFIYSLSLYKRGCSVALKGWCFSSLSVNFVRNKPCVWKLRGSCEQSEGMHFQFASTLVWVRPERIDEGCMCERSWASQIPAVIGKKQCCIWPTT